MDRLLIGRIARKRLPIMNMRVECPHCVSLMDVATRLRFGVTINVIIKCDTCKGDFQFYTETKILPLLNRIRMHFYHKDNVQDTRNRKALY